MLYTLANVSSFSLCLDNWTIVHRMKTTNIIVVLQHTLLLFHCFSLTDMVTELLVQVVLVMHHRYILSLTHIPFIWTSLCNMLFLLHRNMLCPRLFSIRISHLQLPLPTYTTTMYSKDFLQRKCSFVFLSYWNHFLKIIHCFIQLCDVFFFIGKINK